MYLFMYLFIYVFTYLCMYLFMYLFIDYIQQEPGKTQYWTSNKIKGCHLNASRVKIT